MKKFLYRFIHEEDGAELIEWAIVLGIVAILGGSVLALATLGKQKIDDASNLISQINPSTITGAGGSSGGSSTTGGTGASGSTGAGGIGGTTGTGGASGN